MNADSMLDMASMILDFGRVNRVTYHQDGTTLESDTDHTVMLAVIAPELAYREGQHLDVGLVSRFAVVHDLVEVYSGDVNTLVATNNQLADKKHKEEVALGRIYDRFDRSFPHMVACLMMYEAQNISEARFVRAVDKILPKLTHILNHGATFIDDGVSVEYLEEFLREQRAQVATYAGEFTGLMNLRDELTKRVLEVARLRLATA